MPKIKKENFGKQLGKCIGKWVATDDHRVIACGKTIKEVEKKAADAHVEKPVIFQVPDVREGQSFF